MDFIVDNYFWFIVGGILILMIIIGYIAERTDFGRKPFKEKKAPVKEADATNEVIAEENVEEAVAPVEDDFNGFAIPDDLTEIESNDDVNEELGSEVQNIEDNNIDVAEETIEEPMSDLDIPEITDTEAEVEPDVSDVVEEVINDETEDDVWKF